MKYVKFIIILLLFSWCVCFAEAQRRPVIGISDLYKDDNSSAVPRSYVNAVLQVGGLPVVVPLMYDDDKIVELLNTLDGIIFTGGEDFDPSYYNERPIPQMGKINASRDEFDIKLLHLAVKHGVPVLGICRGLQLINIAYGGSLYQDLAAQYQDNSIRHRQRQPKEDASHSVLVEDNTVFADIVRERMLMVNSSHHQAIKKVAPGFRVAGKSPDKIVEVIEKIDSDNWILGVQFHPEVRVTKDNAMRRIFQRFIDEAAGNENPNRKIKTASVSQPRMRQESTSQQQVNIEPVHEPQIVYKSVTDTQFIYKFVVDTQYVYKSVDTVYVPTDTQYIYMPADTVYLSVVDTIYFPVEEIDNLAVSGPNSVKESANDNVESVSDTMIFTPGEIIIPVKKDSSKSKEKNEKKEAAKAAKTAAKEAEKAAAKEAEEKGQQYRKEQMDRAKQSKKEQKEKSLQTKEELKEKELQKKIEEKQQKEKEAWAKKEAEEKEKQFKRDQKENAKLDKKELKEKEKQDKK